MRLDSGYEERRARIEMVPLIDCMFLLLVFFMYAMVSMTVHRGIRVTLPQGEAPAQQKTPLIVSLTADNKLMIGERVLELEEVVREVTAQVKGKDVPVMINGDRASELGPALELLSRLRAGGVETVSFLIEKKTP